MLYWVSGAIGSSIRLYYESSHNPWRLGPDERIEVPTGFALFPGEPFRPLRSWVERALNIQQWSEMRSGGHFAAMEEPAAYVEDVRSFFRRVR